VGGRSEVKVGKHAPSLGNGGEVFPQNLPRSSLDIQNEFPFGGASLGRMARAFSCSPFGTMARVPKKSLNV